MTETVAVFGGSFNPPHVGHVLAAAYVLAAERIDRLLVVPTFQHPFHGQPSFKELAAFAHRVAMARLAFADLARAEVSEIERELADAPGAAGRAPERPSYTVDTLEALRQRHADWRLRLVVGQDVLRERDKWHRPERVAELAPFLVLDRVRAVGGHRAAGWADTEQPAIFPEVSSTDVRAALARGDEAFAARWLPWRVREYVAAHGLYRNGER